MVAAAMAELAKVLGLPTLTFYGTGLILGAGIFSIIGAAAGVAGTGLWLAFLVAAAVASLSALSYAELVAMFPRAGAEYQYVREAFPRPRVAAPAAGLVLAASATMAAATVGVAFGGYLRIFFDVPVWSAAVALLLVATGFNVLGVRESAWANVVLTLLEVGGLMLVVWVGATGPGLPEGFGVAPVGPLVAAAGLLFFAFLGFEDVANLAEEAKRPERDAPRAIFLSVGLATGIYILVAAASVALLAPDALAQSGAPLAEAVAARRPAYETTMGAVALAATANTALVAMVAGTRLVFAVGRGGDAPEVMGRTSSRGSPWVAALVVGALATAIAPFGDVALLGGTASLAALVAFVVVDACVVRLRFSRPQTQRPFCIPWTIRRVPVLPVLGAVAAGAFAFNFGARTYWLASGLAALIVVALVLGRRARA